MLIHLRQNLHKAKFERAIEQGTRTTTGEPGPAYWTNRADYAIEVSLSPETKMLHGTETIRYHNNSPDELRFVLIHLRQNLHKENAMRNRFVPITGGGPVPRPRARRTAGRRRAAEKRGVEAW